MKTLQAAFSIVLRCWGGRIGLELAAVLASGESAGGDPGERMVAADRGIWVGFG